MAVLHKNTDLEAAANNAPGRAPLKSGSVYATLQSRFFMYDLIKITSRKSTSKIITFYFRIPKLEEYDAQILEQRDILSRLNSKPQISYAFAFKRQEFEETSMSFEFELEKDAKMCIASVSSLYKQLKDSCKRNKHIPKHISDYIEELVDNARKE